jgi:hypothetical protein
MQVALTTAVWCSAAISRAGGSISELYFLIGSPKMALAETEQLTRMVASAALSGAICTIGELGVADHIEMGTPQRVEKLAQRTGVHETTLYRPLRFTASYGVFREAAHREFDHTSLSAALHADGGHWRRQWVAARRGATAIPTPERHSVWPGPRGRAAPRGNAGAGA